eukprot:6214025-Pleurochrysis_carterae.AAC.2
MRESGCCLCLCALQIKSGGYGLLDVAFIPGTNEACAATPDLLPHSYSSRIYPLKLPSPSSQPPIMPSQTRTSNPLPPQPFFPASKHALTNTHK